MAVLLKNLVARRPQTQDLGAISELIAVCESAGYSMADSTLEDLLSRWHQADEYLANDAWVIVTTRGQIVGFACVWHEDYTRISTFVGVHPEYRQRGIGTLLVRLVEERARQYSRLAPAGARVVLLAQVSRENRGVQTLLVREGYQPGREFLRISFALAEDTGPLSVPQAQQKLRADVSLEHGRLLGAAPLYDRDGLCSVQFYLIYEKELRPICAASAGEDARPATMAGLR